MAQYKYKQFLNESNHAAFDTKYAPGTVAGNPGIYRCAGCGEEIVIAKARALPTESHHEHEQGLGKMEWQLVVFAQQSR